MKIIAVANQKGGTGKTTTVCNLGAQLARSSHRVLILDLDSQANLTQSFGLEPDSYELTVRELLLDPSVSVKNVAIDVRPNLHLIPANLSLAGIEIELAPAINRDQRLRRKLRDVTAQYDVALIDCPPAISYATLNAFAAASVVLVCVQTQVFSLRAVERLLQTIDDVAEQYETAMSAYALPTMFERNSNADKAVLESLQDRFGPYCFAPIHKNVVCRQAQIAGQPVIEFNRSSSAAVDYARLAKEVTREFIEQGESEASSQSAPYNR